MSTTIEWTDETWNPLRARRRDGSGKIGWACVRVSPGCVNCYAATQNRSGWAGGTGLDYTVPDLAKVRVYLDEKTLGKPLHWRKPRRVFVCSMTDLFGEWVADDEIDRVFAVMALADRHTFQVLTKRPERMRAYISAARFHELNEAAQALTGREIAIEPTQRHGMVPTNWPVRNIWLGTSVEDQKAADERIPHLLATPAAVRFLSCEPLLGPVDLGRWLSASRCDIHGAVNEQHDCHWFDGKPQPRIDWVIVGGESGSRARPMDLAWARSLVDQCRAAGVAPFVKQLGSKPFAPDADWRDGTVVYRNDRRGTLMALRESHGCDPDEWPDDLRVREWPKQLTLSGAA